MKKIKKQIHWIKSKLKLNKRRLILLSIVILITGIIIGGVLFSQQKWNDYSNTYSRQFSDSQSDIESALLHISEKADVSKADRINQFSQLQIKLSNESKKYCDVDSLIKWQSFIGRYSNEVSTCLQQKTHIEKLLGTFNKIVAYLKADKELADIISSADSQTNLNNQADKWNQIESFWRQASTSASKLTDVYQFKDTKTAAVSTINSIADAWASLSSANDSQNRQQYNDASTNLTAVYATVTTISDTSTKQLNVIILELYALL